MIPLRFSLKPLGWLVPMTVCWACSAERADVSPPTITAAVDSATRAFEAAERAQDAEGIIAHLAPEFYMYTDGVRSSYDSVVATIRRTMGSLEYFEPTFRNLEVRVVGPDAAVVSFTFRDSIVTGAGEIIRSTGPTTLVWERRGGDWLIVYADADHYPVP